MGDPSAQGSSGVHESAFVHESAYVDEGATVGAGTKIWHFCHLMSGSSVGDGCTLGQNVFVGADVVVGSNVKIQNNVSLYTGLVVEDDVFLGPSMVFTNVINPRSHVPRKDEFLPTRVRRGATVGANATVVCGVALGRYSFVGAGAVVTRDVPDHALFVGVPARLKGWVCRCGVGLDFGPGEVPAPGPSPASDRVPHTAAADRDSDEARGGDAREDGVESATCPGCGTTYEKRDDAVSVSEESDE